ncbi:hypothetical protein [Ideonella sp. BN130291]|uniref:hypothetical protein n=1 Tax=Ideonella sp. BN130291 TaxID=3112940 RepID=UPI002E25827E|nr:hypothetical protein [Ideonella sp. BN130291]
MNLRFKTSLLEHAKAVGAWARARHARTTIDAMDLSLTVRFESREFRLLPQFVGRRDGKQLVYFDVPDRFAIGFVGWLPYRAQGWDISLSKLDFKKAARDLDIPTPAHWLQLESVTAPFVVKRARGAFGYGMRGPFKASEAGKLSLQEGEYCEEFKWGRIARAWYWSGTLAVLEVFDMPRVTGDGSHTYAELLQRASPEAPADHEHLARLQGVEPGDVPPAGTQVVCDYRYVSPFNPTVYENSNLLPRLAGTPLAQRFVDAGQRLWPRIPGPPGRQIGFALDAIVDANDQPWFLEVNSNPQWHPDIYGPMLDALCPMAAA